MDHEDPPLPWGKTHKGSQGNRDSPCTPMEVLTDVSSRESPTLTKNFTKIQNRGGPFGPRVGSHVNEDPPISKWDVGGVSSRSTVITNMGT